MAFEKRMRFGNLRQGADARTAGTH
jgi:hypothetical protein